MADHRGQFTYQPIGHLARNRKLAVALRLFWIAVWVSAPTAPVLQLAVTVFGERAKTVADYLKAAASG